MLDSKSKGNWSLKIASLLGLVSHQGWYEIGEHETTKIPYLNCLWVKKISKDYDGQTAPWKMNTSKGHNSGCVTFSVIWIEDQCLYMIQHLQVSEGVLMTLHLNICRNSTDVHPWLQSFASVTCYFCLVCTLLVNTKIIGSKYRY